MIESLRGVELDVKWCRVTSRRSAIHRAGGALLIALIFTLLVRKDLRTPVFAMLTLGIASHFVIDYFLWQPTGTTNLMLWPFLDLTLDYQGFYLSSDRWPAVVSTIASGLILHLGEVGGDTILRYDTAHERTNGHERHTQDGVAITQFPGMLTLYDRFKREAEELSPVSWVWQA